MGDGTDRHKPLHPRVSSVKGVTVVHQLEVEETVGCRACLGCSIQHRSLCWHADVGAIWTNSIVSIHIHERLASYLFTHSAHMHPHSVEHSPDKSDEDSSSNADAESE